MGLIDSKTKRVSILILLVALSAMVSVAQFESGTVLGTILDSSNAGVSGASVTIVNVRNGVSAKTLSDASGNYEFVNQRLGSYRVRVEMKGFKTSDTDGFDLTVNARQRVDLKLVVGEVSESVTVSGAVELLESDNSSRETTGPAMSKAGISASSGNSPKTCSSTWGTWTTTMWD